MVPRGPYQLTRRGREITYARVPEIGYYDGAVEAILNNQNTVIQNLQNLQGKLSNKMRREIFEKILLFMSSSYPFILFSAHRAVERMSQEQQEHFISEKVLNDLKSSIMNMLEMERLLKIGRIKTFAQYWETLDENTRIFWNKASADLFDHIAHTRAYITRSSIRARRQPP
jgi:hypothetical protein